VIAEGVKIYDKVPSAEEMSQILFPEGNTGKMPGMKTRSIRFTPKTENRQEASGIGLPIRFGLNSDNILNESFPYLDQIGTMLKMNNLSDKKLLIEGHTDAKGSYQHNRKLSERRALAVKTYLTLKYDISPNRLKSIGKGEMETLKGKDPVDPLNRRVEFYSLE
jgi:outer membrane protein OmpA-like peptidoglycan-associated protein